MVNDCSGSQHTIFTIAEEQGLVPEEGISHSKRYTFQDCGLPTEDTIPNSTITQFNLSTLLMVQFLFTMIMRVQDF